MKQMMKTLLVPMVALGCSLAITANAHDATEELFSLLQPPALTLLPTGMLLKMASVKSAIHRPRIVVMTIHSRMKGLMQVT